MISIFCFDAIIFALLTVRIYDAWKAESCQNHFQRLLSDLTKLWKITECWRNLKLECIQIDQQNSQQNSQLFTNDRRNDVDLLHCFRIFVDFFCFNDRSLERHSTSQRNLMKRSPMRKERLNWSLRDETEKKRKIMWRACIGFNIWSIIKINILILSHRMTGSRFVYDQIFYICFRKSSVFVFSLRYSRVIMY